MRDRCEPAGRDDVAHPGQPGEGQRVRAGRDPEPGHLGQAAGQQAGLAVVAEAEPVGRTCRDRDHVLERPAQLDAEDVLVDVEPEATSCDPCRDPLGEREVRGRDDGRGREVARDLGGEVRARQRRDPADRHARRLGDDLAHPQQRPALEALDHRQQVRLGRQEGRDGLDGRPQVGRRRREDDEVGGVAQRARVGRRDHRRRQVDPRQARLVPPGRGDPCRRLRGVAQERDRLHPGHDPCQRRPPRAGPDDRDARTRHQPVPSARLACPPRGPATRPLAGRDRGAPQLLAARQLDRRPVAEDEPDRRPVEAELLAQPVLEVAPVAEVDRPTRPRRRTRTSAARRRPGSRRRASAGGRGPAAAASAPSADDQDRLSSPVEIRLRRSPQMSIGGLEHAPDALAGLGADRDDRREVEERDLVADPLDVLVERLVGLVLDEVPLVDRDDEALALLDDVARDVGVLRRSGPRRHRRRGPRRRPATSAWSARSVEYFSAAGPPATLPRRRIPAVSISTTSLRPHARRRVDGVAGRARDLRDDRPLLAEQRVEQARLADVRAADERDRRRARRRRRPSRRPIWRASASTPSRSGASAPSVPSASPASGSPTTNGSRRPAATSSAQASASASRALRASSPRSRAAAPRRSRRAGRPMPRPWVAEIA